jgi:hypothetical protein
MVKSPTGLQAGATTTPISLYSFIAPGAAVILLLMSCHFLISASPASSECFSSAKRSIKCDQPYWMVNDYRQPEIVCQDVVDPQQRIDHRVGGLKDPDL